MFGLLLPAAEVAGYVFVALPVTAGFLYYTAGGGPSDFPKGLCVLAGALWPFTLGALALAGLAIVFYEGANSLALAAGAKYRKKSVDHAKIKMMEADLERTRVLDYSALGYQYGMCQECYGRGCSDCHEGVVRKKIKEIGSRERWEA